MSDRKKSHVLRPPGLLVFLVVCVALAGAWYLYSDRLVKRGVEASGTSMVGARVEVASADVRPTAGSVRLTGLAVTNPNAPMTNLFEAEEVLVDLLLEPLLTRKVVVQDLVVTGVRFNTPRTESGALENPDPQSGQLFREIDAWADQIDIPPLSLEGLSTVVRTDAISTDSLRTVQRARVLVQGADSMRDAWEQRIQSLDPRPRIDSLEAVVQRLEGFRLTPLNAARLPELVRDGRAALAQLTELRQELTDLAEDARGGVRSLRSGVEEFPELRTQDLAYARSLLNLPSLEGPDISPSIFGGAALTWLKPVLYWAHKAERYVPPGLDPRNRPGPRRARAEGTTVEFPGRAAYPSFLLQHGVLGLEIAGDGPAAGVYSADLRNLTSQPSLVGAPVELTVGREEGGLGPEAVSLVAVLDHTSAVLRDSVSLSLAGIGLPSLTLDALDARLDLGPGDVSFDFLRVGDQIEARLNWSSESIRWLAAETGAGPTAAGAREPPTLAESLGSLSAAELQAGSAEWARSLLWRTVSGLQRVDLTMGLSGRITSPSLSIESNVGSAIAASLRQELGREIEAAETRLRQEINDRVQPLVLDAHARLENLETQVLGRVEARRTEVEEIRARLQQRLDELVRIG